MKVVVKPDLKLQALSSRESYTLPRERVIGLANTKFYQKLFVLLISFSTFLIFPESPRELENICENYNSRELCNVW